VKGRPFTLAHWYKVLEKEEKWRNRDMEVPIRAKLDPHLVGDDDDDDGSIKWWCEEKPYS
jgi:hypothetical protein